MPEEGGPGMSDVVKELPAGFGQERVDLGLNVQEAHAAARGRKVPDGCPWKEVATVWGAFLRTLRSGSELVDRTLDELLPVHGRSVKL
jgi:hypothetical protein